MKVAVIGAGIMGSGIGQATAMAGHEVALRDIGPSELERAEAAIDKSLARFVKSAKIDASQKDAIARRISYTTEIATAADGADVVIEAVPEIFELKRDVLRQAADSAPADALFGTNTSQLSITSIGATLEGDAERLIGVHFFNPPVLMKLVELIRGAATADATVQRARDFVTGIGKEVVVCNKDTPGFITTRAYAAFRQECMKILEEGIASVEDIDKALKLGFNLPMGPLELSDFNGVDTYFHVTTALEKAYGERFRPTPTLTNMIAAGRLGRKTGAGFYEYDEKGQKKQ